ncbi:hypothetical protein CHELA40_13581 [Chelatococcus asaccharovorans]|nr:hypothetical protein CHELA40_13581 [Chelatococcus asaccharovorans]CAH1677038.1 hypothetical protein CHELA17_62041 [Chelatococcus asaccharovorans]
MPRFQAVTEIILYLKYLAGNDPERAADVRNVAASDGASDRPVSRTDLRRAAPPNAPAVRPRRR